jgi:hypothetical protein
MRDHISLVESVEFLPFVARALPSSLRAKALDFDKTHGLNVSNPIARAIAAGYDTKSAEEWMTHNTLTITAWYAKNLMLDTKRLATIPGERREHTRMHEPASQEKIAELAKSMAKNGFDHSFPIAVRVYPSQTTSRFAFGIKVFEGNHRIRAAIEAGIDHIAVEWKWCGGSELKGLYHPVMYGSV